MFADYDNRRIIVFTHTDLDGSACAVLAHLAAYSHKIPIEINHVNYDTVDSAVQSFLMRRVVGWKYICLITDISVNEQTAKQIDSWVKRTGSFVSLCDHHELSDSLLQREWVTCGDSNTCGASLLWEQLFSIFRMDNLRKLSVILAKEFVEDVRKYDTWSFDKDKLSNPESLNILLKLLGNEEFESEIMDMLLRLDSSILNIQDSDKYGSFVESFYKQKKKHCALCNKNLRTTKYKGYNVGIVFSQSHISAVGDYVLSQNPDLDFCAIVNFPSTVSLRTKRNDLNLAQEIAKPLGGGGHPQSAGFVIPKYVSESVSHLILSD